MLLAASLEQKLPDLLHPQIPSLLRQGWSSSSCIRDPQVQMGLRGSARIKWEGKNTEEEKSDLMKERRRTKPGRQINLRDAETRKRHIKGLSGEEVMGRENTEPLNQND